MAQELMISLLLNHLALRDKPRKDLVWQIDKSRFIKTD